MSLRSFDITEYNYTPYNKTVLLNTDNIISSNSKDGSYVILYNNRGSSSSVFDKIISSTAVDDTTGYYNPTSATVSVFYAVSEVSNAVDRVISEEDIVFCEETGFGSVMLCNFGGSQKKLYTLLTVAEIAELFATESIPLFESALFWLDGTVSGDEFVDKSGNNRNFTINNKDFTGSYFPYKSAATISAPVGDATLIAADINNFLYDSSGDPNAIPVVSFFQDIDYEHKLFTRHVAQTVDANGVEVIEPHVKDIALYDAVLSGDDLTTAQTYYEVPEEDPDAIWISPDGDNFAAGTKAAPWQTLMKATYQIDKTIYIKTGVYSENSTSTTAGYWLIQRGSSYKGIGGVTVKSQSAAARVCAIFDPYSVDFEGIVFDCETIKIGLEFLGTTADKTSSIKRCSAIDCVSGFITGTVDNLTFQYNIATYTTRGLLFSTGSPTMDTCLMKCTDGAGAAISQLGTSVLGDVTVKNSILLDSTISTQGNCDFSIYGNYIEIGTTLISGLSYTDVNILMRWNTIISTGNSGVNILGIDVAEIQNNYVTCENSGDYFSISLKGTDITVSNNILPGGGGDYCNIIINGDTATTIDISNNRMSANTDDFMIGIGTYDTTGKDTISGVIENNTLIGGDIVSATAHALYIFNQKDIIVRYNKVSDSGLGIVYKNYGLDSTNGGVFYNVVENCQNGLVIKGPDNLKAYGNTVINSNNFGISVADAEDDGSGDTSTHPCENLQVKNNIIVDYEGNINYAWSISGNVVTPDIDYNITFTQLATEITAISPFTWATHQGLGYDANGINQNPVLTNGIPQTGSPAIGAGETLAAAYDDGLDDSTDWGSSSQVPSVVTKQQALAWDIGAYIS